MSPGCANCYAETLSRRNPAVLGEWGKGKPRVLAKNWDDPLRWNKAAMFRVGCGSCGWIGDQRKPCGCHYKFHFPVVADRTTVFPQLCDWLDEEVPAEWLVMFLKLIVATPNLRWLLLTKRPEKWLRRMDGAALTYLEMRKNPVEVYLREWILAWINGQPPSNVWVGTSVEDQQRADERITCLLRIPAAGRFLSVEPLLGAVDLSRAGLWLCKHWKAEDCLGKAPWCPTDPSKWRWEPQALRGTSQKMLDWVIIGGESGPGARPCNVEWVRFIVRQCKAAKVPCFVKQLGSVVDVHESEEPFGDTREVNGRWITKLNHAKGGDPSEWPDDLRVREVPEGLREMTKHQGPNPKEQP